VFPYRVENTWKNYYHCFQASGNEKFAVNGILINFEIRSKYRISKALGSLL
jgi:hypothetical protein